ncbi:hypothetical protein EST38_g11468 [Candolleomyces aberdarensis]|uniref:THIF-type NAD/FAD binding fold domain-containing protein n=1 Tax=Candolleomyces aberdarensis TaxID=2316362 RepID=A0A4Q2D721_9AGAR|nr:hypothetical protein EST38_g11468 [Candolleomyces aberdarensis]
MSTAQGRGTHAKAILGPELYAKLADIHVLLVGAGSIGWELLKNIVLTGFGKITPLDLDLSNLNRQFLFRKKDVKQSKALVAAQTASAFNPNVKILPIHGNIKKPQYDTSWFQQFGLVLNTLDNLATPEGQNRMLRLYTQANAKDVPCLRHPFHPEPIYLMGQLFGEDGDATGELDAAEKEGGNAQKIAALRKEATAEDAAELVFRKVFDADIRNLLSMADMWKSRSLPILLDLGGIMNDSLVLCQGTDLHPNGASVSTSKVPNPPAPVNGQTNGAAPKLKDQRTLSLKDNVLLFIDRYARSLFVLGWGFLLWVQYKPHGEETISFDKDDDDTLDLVTAASNLRSSTYGIEKKTRWEVKVHVFSFCITTPLLSINIEMAGNIIPAIATTNAIVSGVIVLQALHLLRKSRDELRNVYPQFKPAVH